MKAQNSIFQFSFSAYAHPFKVLRYRRLMKEAPFWREDKLRDWSLSARASVLKHAIDTVPFYGEHYSGLEKELLPELNEESWQRLPTINKEKILQAPGRFVSSAADETRCGWAHTSGSTGLKLDILLDENINSAAFALFWRAWSSGDYWHLGQRHAVLKAPTSSRGWRINRKLRALELAASHLRRDTIKEIRNRIAEYRPRFLRGYPSAIFILCQLLEEGDLQLEIPMVVSGAETLDPYQRRRIEEVLGARLYNHYTHWERAASILECSQGNLHAQEDYGFHEILDSEDKPVSAGEPGEITVTSLHNRAMPLIRYRTGDYASWGASECSCGQGFPVVSSIEGRRNDNIVKRDGTVVPGTYAGAVFGTADSVLAAQLIQNDLDSVEIRIVKKESYRDPEDTESIVRDLKRRFGDDMAIELRFCALDGLERSPVGKIRRCISRVDGLDPIARGSGVTSQTAEGEPVVTSLD